MKEIKKIKENLHGKLPYGSLTEIVKRLKEERGIDRSVSHVRNVLNPETNKWDADVIDVAQNMLLDLQATVIKASEKLTTK